MVHWLLAMMPLYAGMPRKNEMVARPSSGRGGRLREPLWSFVTIVAAAMVTRYLIVAGAAPSIL